jgi:hypothetical protein
VHNGSRVKTVLVIFKPNPKQAQERLIIRDAEARRGQEARDRLINLESASQRICYVMTTLESETSLPEHISLLQYDDTSQHVAAVREKMSTLRD